MRGRPPTITDDELLEAARSVFLEQGVGTTTAEIARRAGISESVLFHRYGTKEALFLAVLDRLTQVAPVLETLGERVGQGELCEQLFEIGAGIVEDVRRVMPFFILGATMAQAASWKLDELRERMQRPHPAQTRSLKLLAGYFEAESNAHRLRPVDSEILARAFLGALAQHVLQNYWGGSPDGLPLSTPIFLRGLIDILLNGTAAHPKPRGR